MTSRLLRVTLCVFIVLQTSDGVPQEASFSCYYKTGNKHIKFELEKNDDDVTDIFAEKKWSTCSLGNSQVTGDGSSARPYTLEVDQQTSTPDCGITVVDSNVFEMTVIVQSEALLQQTDKKYVMTCNFTAIVAGTAGTGPTNISSSTITDGTATQEAVANMVLRDATTFAKVTSTTLGHQVKLYVWLSADYTHNKAMMRVQGCKAIAGDGSKEVEIFDSNGCDVTTVLKTKFGPLSSYTSAQTGAFAMFTVSSQATISITCSIKICFSHASGPCKQPYCGSTGRRKRSTDVTSKDVVTKVKVCLPSQTDCQSEDEKTGEPLDVLGMCLHNSHIIATLVTMGTLLLLAITSTLFFCWRAYVAHARSRDKDPRDPPRHSSRDSNLALRHPPRDTAVHSRHSSRGEPHRYWTRDTGIHSRH